MKKNIIKPKFYTLDKDTIKTPQTGYIFKHYPAKVNNNNKILTSALTKLYYKNETDKYNNQYIQIAERQEKMSKEDFIQYLIINYKLPKSGFKLKRIINSDKIVVYLIYLNIETKISLYYESIRTNK